MADGQKRVELLRVPREEKMYSVEEVFGRDVRSVFPTRAKDEEAGSSGLDVDAIKEALGARRFISESELEHIAATRGKTADDGAVSVDKPLAEILAERKAAKEEEFQKQWKQMKTGKNRPLDEDELEFLDKMFDAQASAEREASDAERRELEEFRQALQARSASSLEAGPPDALLHVDPTDPFDPLGGGSSGAGALDTLAAAPGGMIGPQMGPRGAKPGLVGVKPAAAAAKPLIQLKVVPKAGAGGRAAAAAPATAEPAAKKQKTEQEAVASDSGGGLAGLLGGYGSDDSS